MRIERKRFVPYYINTGFPNNDNRKECVQKRIGPDTEVNFLNALNNIDGDHRERKGEQFSEVVLLALAYFYKAIFPEEHNIKDSYWSVQAVKGFFDACNLTPYTPIDQVVTTYFRLRDPALFRHCYLIIQTAYFFNSENFGSHQILTYTDHYRTTGKQLPIKDYKYDKEYLLKSYKDIDEARSTKFESKKVGERYTSEWYYYILFLVVTELGLEKKNFIVTETKHREYNPVTKTRRILRGETPFVITHIDIKSAYPSFLDAITESEVAPTIYERVAEAKKVSRDKAKTLFLIMLNSGKRYYWKEEKAIQDLIEWGYTKDQAKEVTQFTHDPNKSFTEHMSEIEEEAIKVIAEVNAIDKYVRLHDALLYIDSKKPNVIVELENGVIKFESEVLKKPTINTSFGIGDRRLRYGYTASVPQLKNLTRRTVPSGRKTKGDANGFRFFFQKYEYHSATFNLNYKFDFEEFKDAYRDTFNALYALNRRKVKTSEIEAITKHIRRYSNICFQHEYMVQVLNELNEKAIPRIEIKERDWEFTEKMSFRTIQDFNNARGEAQKIVNQKHLVKVVKERFVQSLEEGEKGWIEFGIPDNKNYKLARVLANRINYLRTNRKRKPKAQIDSSEPLYTLTLKGPPINRIEPQKSKFANTENIVRRRIKKYERELLELIRRESEIKSAEQYIFILNELINGEETFGLERNEEFLQEEKKFIAETLEVQEFRELILIKPDHEITPKEATEEIFDTDLTDSIFNQLSEEQANARGLLEEFQAFHKLKPNVNFESTG